ncbi:glycosyltransferase [Sphaerisporangium sp. B11E5]|uniref:glycosyltransferase family 2 protein n=1 Tax=Sphaerisporangium sp. B11E5 TaxID=3153563 RepID=UPI00325E1B62
MGTPWGEAVSVVIATRDRRAELLRTLERLAELPERPHVIVVDNGSSDGGPDAVTERFPQVELIRLGRNHGAVARNVGVEAASTPYVAFCDDDSWWEPGALRRAAELFAAEPRLGLVAARVLVGPERTPDPINAQLAAGAPVLGFMACGAVVRRQAFLEAGGFSDVLVFPGEEQLMAYDLASLGWERRYVPEVVAVHEPSSLRSAASGRRRLELRNALLTTWLRRPRRVVLRDTVRAAGRMWADPDARWAMLGALRRLPDAIGGRRRLPTSIEADARRVETAGRDRR